MPNQFPSSQGRSASALVPDHVTVDVRGPAELVASVPTLTGFHVTESLVLVALGGVSGRRVGLAVRIDLAAPEHDPTIAAAAVSGLMRGSPQEATVMVFSTASGADPPRSALVDVVGLELARRGVPVRTVIWAESTTAGSRWSCYDGCCGGLIPEPSTLPLLAASTLNGQVVYASRAELERVVAPTEPERLRRREQRLIEVIDAAAAGDPAGARACDVAAGVARVERAVAEAAQGRLELDDDAVVELAMALSLPSVRDDAIRHSGGPHAAAAEQLWAALTRETPDPEAAEPACLLAATALIRGDGALANVAIERAERAWPGHRFGRLLSAVARAGISPEELRASLDAGTAPWSSRAKRARGRRRGRARRSRR